MIIEGDDAKEFWRQMKDLECTEEGIKLVLEAAEMAREKDNEDKMTIKVLCELARQTTRVKELESRIKELEDEIEKLKTMMEESI